MIEIVEIGPSYNEDILKIIRDSPIETEGLTLCFDRSPDFFKLSHVGYDYCRYAGLIKDNKLQGIAGTCYFEGLINQEYTTIIYYTSLYLRNAARNHGFFYQSSEVLGTQLYNDCKYGMSIIMKGNKLATKLISRRVDKYPWMFHNKIVDTLKVENIIISTHKKNRKGYQIRAANENDIHEIIGLLQDNYSGRTFAPKVDRINFLRTLEKRDGIELSDYYIAEQDGKMVGMCAAWNTTSFKQTKVLEYKGKYRWIRKLNNLARPFLGLPSLPKPGENLKEITLLDFAVKDNNEEIMKALITHIYNVYRRQNFNTIIFGSYESDPLLKAVESFNATSVESHIVIAGRNKELLDQISVNKPYINVAIL